MPLCRYSGLQKVTPMARKITVYVDEELHRRLKAAASLRGQALSDFMLEAARRVLEAPDRRRAAAHMDRVRRRIRRADGTVARLAGPGGGRARLCPTRPTDLLVRGGQRVVGGYSAQPDRPGSSARRPRGAPGLRLRDVGGGAAKLLGDGPGGGPLGLRRSLFASRDGSRLRALDPRPLPGLRRSREGAPGRASRYVEHGSSCFPLAPRPCYTRG